MLDKLKTTEKKEYYFGGRVTKEQDKYINEICKKNNINKSKILEVMLDTLIEEYKKDKNKKIERLKNEN